MSPANLPHINFMASCVVEVFGLDSAAAYELAFGYLRQLAVLLRGAQVNFTPPCWNPILLCSCPQSILMGDLQQRLAYAQS